MDRWQSRTGIPACLKIRCTRKGLELVRLLFHTAEEGGFWAEVLVLPGCATQSETFEELLMNIYEAIEGCLSVDIDPA